MEKFQESSSSQRPRQTTDGNAIRRARYANSSKLPRGVTEETADTVVQMYENNAGTAQEISNTMRVSLSSVYRILKVRKVQLRYPLKSIAAQQQRAPKPKRVEPEPDFSTPPAVDYVPDPPKPKPRRTKKKKTWIQRVFDFFR